jgi:Transglutaminase-like superfamily
VVEEATSTLDFEATGKQPAINARRLRRFLQSAALAALWLRCRSLHSISAAVAVRRERFGAGIPEAVSPEAMLEAAAAYEKLRPFALTAQDKCLHDSLTLVDFLAAEGLFPRWVIGVRARPFGAHSWVQIGGTVLNDQHEHVRRFRPILVV